MPERVFQQLFHDPVKSKLGYMSKGLISVAVDLDTRDRLAMELRTQLVRDLHDGILGAPSTLNDTDLIALKFTLFFIYGLVPCKSKIETPKRRLLLGANCSSFRRLLDN